MRARTLCKKLNAGEKRPVWSAEMRLDMELRSKLLVPILISLFYYSCYRCTLLCPHFPHLWFESLLGCRTWPQNWLWWGNEGWGLVAWTSCSVMRVHSGLSISKFITSSNVGLFLSFKCRSFPMGSNSVVWQRCWFLHFWLGPSSCLRWPWANCLQNCRPISSCTSNSQSQSLVLVNSSRSLRINWTH